MTFRVCFWQRTMRGSIVSCQMADRSSNGSLQKGVKRGFNARSIIFAFVFCTRSKCESASANFPSAQAEMRFRIRSERILEIWPVVPHELKRKMLMGRVVMMFLRSGTCGLTRCPTPPPLIRLRLSEL
jgi:hypothetical protein